MAKIFLNLKIYKNFVLNEAAEYRLKTRALCAWEGAEFSNGEAATVEMLQELADSVNVETYQPPLLLNHDWQAEKIIGLMTAIRNEENGLFADFDVLSEFAGKKIESGEWQNISLTFERDENGKVRVLECSIVAIPQIAGAKIEPVEMSENAADPPAEIEEEPEKDEKPEETKKTEENEENACGDDREENACGETGKNEEKPGEKEIIANARISALENEKAVLNKKVKDLEKRLKTREKEIIVNAKLDAWVKAGKTSPAVLPTEKALLMSFNEAQLERYSIIKNDCKGQIFGRISSPFIPDNHEDRENRLLERYEQKRGLKNGN